MQQTAQNKRFLSSKRVRFQGYVLVSAVALMLGWAALFGGAHSQAASSPAANAGQNDRALPGDGAPTRIGVYDSRAICIAYVHSDSFKAHMSDLMTQRAQAEKAGDKARIDELDALGKSMQLRIHLQGFSTAPVDDILDTVRDELPGIARAEHVVLITREADFTLPGAGVELVDVTDALVAIFNPDMIARKSIEHVRTMEPEPIEKIAQMPAEE